MIYRPVESRREATSSAQVEDFFDCNDDNDTLSQKQAASTYPQHCLLFRELQVHRSKRPCSLKVREIGDATQEVGAYHG